MALNWDCSPAKSCYDLGRARYTIDDQATASRQAHDDEAMDINMMQASRKPNKIRFAWQQRSAGDRFGVPEGHSAQDICSYPASALGPPFAPPRYRAVRPILHCVPKKRSHFNFLITQSNVDFNDFLHTSS